MAKTPTYSFIDGCLFPPSFDRETLYSAMNFKPDKNDIIVATYPKCGTTWVQQIVLLLQRRGVPPATAEEYFASTPFLEVVGAEGVSAMSRPGVIKTHLCFDRLTFSSEAKYIFVARHPADCAVSFFHHARFFPIYFFSDGEFNDFFDIFIKGKVDFGDYFDHLLSWYKQKNKPNILTLTFEEMKADHRGSILKIAKFLGDEYYDPLVQNNGEVLDNVVKYSTVEYMKSSVGCFWSDIFSHAPPEEVQNQSPVLKKFALLAEEAAKLGHQSVGDFVRSGQVGEGKILLTNEQKNLLNLRIQEKTSGSDVMKLWTT